MTDGHDLLLLHPVLADVAVDLVEPGRLVRLASEGLDHLDAGDVLLDRRR
jgi:hypothetical protein